jgi:hypothetical protein
MKTFKKTILPILLATTWISVSEFARNEFLLKSFWTTHLEKLQLIFHRGTQKLEQPCELLIKEESPQ